MQSWRSSRSDEVERAIQPLCTCLYAMLQQDEILADCVDTTSLIGSRPANGLVLREIEEHVIMSGQTFWLPWTEWTMTYNG